MGNPGRRAPPADTAADNPNPQIPSPLITIPARLFFPRCSLPCSLLSLLLVWQLPATRTASRGYLVSSKESRTVKAPAKASSVAPSAAAVARTSTFTGGTSAPSTDEAVRPIHWRFIGGSLIIIDGKKNVDR